VSEGLNVNALGRSVRILHAALVAGLALVGATFFVLLKTRGPLGFFEVPNVLFPALAPLLRGFAILIVVSIVVVLFGAFVQAVHTLRLPVAEP
jgi:ABC-type tungstate transport system substrate-binding protein